LVYSLIKYPNHVNNITIIGNSIPTLSIEIICATQAPPIITEIIEAPIEEYLVVKNNKAPTNSNRDMIGK
jgi:hypothetical protein